MIFNSFEYAIFLAVVLAVYWTAPRRLRPPILLAASWIFYATWDPRLLVLLIGASVLTWGVGRSLPHAAAPRRRLLATVAVLVLVGVLAVFKALEALEGHVAGDLGAGVARGAIPIGLSFFTFQAISYVVDVYRGRLEPDHTFIDVATFIAFFPHLLAGPIVRADKLIPAFHGVGRLPDPVRSAEGAELILVGLFKKVALADPLIAHVVLLNAREGPVTFGNAWVALVAGVVGAYFDITGYVDMARGSAKLLGIDMQRNSLTPLLSSAGYADFWRRWQLTVMMWFRDYVFLPLRGPDRRPSEMRENLALFGTFAALGVWHGATFGWALWGLASGVIIVVERTLQRRRALRRRAAVRAARAAGRKPKRPPTPAHWKELLRTYALVALTLPLLAPSLSGALDIYEAFLRPTWGSLDGDLVALAVMAVAALLVLDHRERQREARAGTRDPVTPLRALGFGVAVLGVIVYAGADAQPFLYFAF